MLTKVVASSLGIPALRAARAAGIEAEPLSISSVCDWTVHLTSAAGITRKTCSNRSPFSNPHILATFVDITDAPNRGECLRAVVRDLRSVNAKVLFALCSKDVEPAAIEAFLSDLFTELKAQEVKP